MKRKNKDVLGPSLSFKPKPLGLLDLPQDVLLKITQILKHHFGYQRYLRSLSATNTKFHNLVLPSLISAPSFKDHQDLLLFKSLFIPHHSDCITTLFSIIDCKKRKYEKSAMELMKVCRKLKTVALDGVYGCWGPSWVECFKEGVWENLRCVQMNTWWSMDLLRYMPQSVTSLVLHKIREGDLRTIGNHIHGLTSFQYEFCNLQATNSEEEIRSEVEFFLKQNMYLKRVNTIFTCRRTFCLMDWIVLDECLKRGISVRSEDDDGIICLSWMTFACLPKSISLQRVANILGEIGGHYQWLFNSNEPNDLSLHQTFQFYHLFMKEYTVEDLNIRLNVFWGSNNLKLLEGIGRIQNIQQLTLSSHQGSDLTTKEHLIRIFEGCLCLKSLQLDFNTLKILQNYTIPPHIHTSLNTTTHEVGGIGVCYLKSFSRVPSLQINFMDFSSPSGEPFFFKVVGSIKELFNRWKRSPIPHTIKISGLYLNSDDPALLPYILNKPITEHLKSVLSQNLWLWDLDYLISISFSETKDGKTQYQIRNY